MKSGGFLPNFNDLDEAESKEYLTTLMEFLRMVRDNDPDSDNERAQHLWDMVSKSDG